MVAGKLSKFVSAVSSVKLHTQQIIISQDLNTILKVTVVEVITSIKKISLENEKKNRHYFNNVLNLRLNAIIYNFQHFAINLQEDIISKQELFALIGKLVKTLYAVQQSFKQNSENLKHKLIENIQDVNDEAADILKIILPLVLELPEEKITAAKNLNNKIQETVLDAIKSLDSLNLQNAIEKKALILESNLFAENINTIIFHLQNVVVELDDGHEEKQNLVELIGKLLESSYAVLKEINKNPEDLKIKLKASLEQVATSSVDLLKIIEKNKLRENGQILCISLSDLQRAIDFVKIRNEVVNESPDKIKEILKDYVTRICNSISSIIFQTDAQALNSIIDAANNQCRHLAGIVDIYVKQHGGKYPEDIRNLMEVTSSELNHAEVELQKLCRKTSNIASLVNLVRENVNKRCEIIAKLICALESGKVETDSENVEAVESPMISSRTMKIKH